LSFQLPSRSLKIEIPKIIISAVPYGYETWFLTLWEEHRLRVFQNRVLRRVFGPNREDVGGVLRRLHNEELCKLYTSPSIIRVIEDGENGYHVAFVGEMRNAYKILIRNSEGMRPFRKPRC
jgi:hypothetical protein